MVSPLQVVGTGLNGNIAFSPPSGPWWKPNHLPFLYSVLVSRDSVQKNMCSVHTSLLVVSFVLFPLLQSRLAHRRHSVFLDPSPGFL